MKINSLDVKTLQVQVRKDDIFGSLTPTEKARVILEDKPTQYLFSFVSLLNLCLGAARGTSVMRSNGFRSLYDYPFYIAEIVALSLQCAVCVFEIAVCATSRRGLRRYLSDWWVWIDILGLSVQWPTYFYNVDVNFVVRCLHSCRVLRINLGLRYQFLTVLAVLSTVCWMLILLLLVIGQYAVVGVAVFSAYSPALFGDLATTYKTLFQALSFDNWASNANQLAAAGAGLYSWVYFISFLCVASFTVLALLPVLIVHIFGNTRRDIAKHAATIIEANRIEYVAQQKRWLKREAAKKEAAMRKAKKELKKRRKAGEAVDVGDDEEGEADTDVVVASTSFAKKKLAVGDSKGRQPTINFIIQANSSMLGSVRPMRVDEMTADDMLSSYAYYDYYATLMVHNKMLEDLQATAEARKVAQAQRAQESWERASNAPKGPDDLAELRNDELMSLLENIYRRLIGVGTSLSFYLTYVFLSAFLFHFFPFSF
jgi:hypothetical protein